MSIALTILLLTVAAPAQGEQFSATIARATRQALGPSAQVLSRSVAVLPSDGEAARLGAEVGADAVAEISWSMPGRLSATIRLERSHSTQWFEREIGFRPVDDPLERDRTVALIIVSMLPERAVEALSTEGRAVLPSASFNRSDRAIGPDANSTEPSVHETPHHTSTLSGVAIAAFGVGDSGAGMGGGIDFRRAFSKKLSLRIGASIRVGEEPTAQAVSRFFYSGAGLAWNTWTSSNGRGAFGFRLDALAMLMAFEHLSADDAAVDVRRKWMPGGDVLAEASYLFAAGAGIVVGGGAEAVFGRTDIFVHGRPVTTIRPVHPVVELGLRVGF